MVSFESAESVCAADFVCICARSHQANLPRFRMGQVGPGSALGYPKGPRARLLLNRTVEMLCHCLRCALGCGALDHKGAMGVPCTRCAHGDTLCFPVRRALSTMMAMGS